jgi:signal transduction histidine kinase
MRSCNRQHVKGKDVRDKVLPADTQRRTRHVCRAMSVGLLALLILLLYLSLLLVAWYTLGHKHVLLAHGLAFVAACLSALLIRRHVQQWTQSPSNYQQLRFSDIAETLTRTLSPDELRLLLTTNLPQLLHLSHATVWVLEAPEDHSFVALGSQERDAVMAFLAHGATAQALASFRDFARVDVAPSAVWSAPFYAQGCELVFPLSADGILIGVYACAVPNNAHQTLRAIEQVIALKPAIASALVQVRSAMQTVRLTAQLQELDQLKTQFVESVGHELRTPLTTLSLGMQLLANQPDNFIALHSVMANSVAHLQTTIDRIMRFEAHLPEPGLREYVNLAGLLEDLARSYAPIAQAKGVYFVVHTQPEVQGYGNPRRIRRGLHEIIDNAVRYTYPGEITLTLTSHDGLALISISDQGPGIPQEERDQLFAAFYRGEQVRALAETPGVGLGLSMARGDIEAQGGRIWLASATQHGTTMHVALPMQPHDTSSPQRERVVGE